MKIYKLGWRKYLINLEYSFNNEKDYKKFIYDFKAALKLTFKWNRFVIINLI